MRRLLPLAVLILSGCVTTKYVQTYCVTAEQLAELRAQRPQAIRDQLTGDADKDLRLVTGKLVRVQAWGDGLLDVLGACLPPA
jgi:hypothetical protein